MVGVRQRVSRARVIVSPHGKCPPSHLDSGRIFSGERLVNPPPSQVTTAAPTHLSTLSHSLPNQSFLFWTACTSLAKTLVASERLACASLFGFSMALLVTKGLLNTSSYCKGRGKSRQKKTLSTPAEAQ